MAEHWFVAVPGPLLAAELAATRVEALDDHDVLEYLAALERLTSWVSARSATALAEFIDRRPPGKQGAQPDDLVARFAADELACRLRWSPRVAATRIEEAHALTTRLSGTLQALASAAISPTHASVMVETTADSSESVAAALERHVLPGAVTQTPAQFRSTAQRVVQALDPDTLVKRHERSVRERRLSVVHHRDGTASVYTRGLRQQDTAALTSWLAATLSARHSEDPRTSDQYRVDMVTGLVTTALLQRAMPDGVGGFTTLPTPPAAPEPVDLSEPPAGSAGYRPGPVLRAYVMARDRTCRFPTCTAPAEYGDLDHTVPFPRGATSHDNLGALCRYHHNAKTTGVFGLRQRPGGWFDWRSPTGHVYTRGPEPDDPPPLPTRPELVRQKPSRAIA